EPSAARLSTTPVLKAYQTRAEMSALGQKQTCAAQKVMSALLPKADISRSFQIFKKVRAMRGVTPALLACRRPLHRHLTEREMPTASPQRSPETEKQCHLD